VFIVVIVYFVIDSVRKRLDTLSYYMKIGPIDDLHLIGPSLDPVASSVRIEP